MVSLMYSPKRSRQTLSANQMHYNEGADLLTYLVDPLVFAIKDGYVEALQGTYFIPSIRTGFASYDTFCRTRTWDRRQRRLGT